MNLYTQDFYQWTRQQAGLLRSGRLAEIDLDHLAEEVENMGKAEKRELLSRLSVLLMHLLKWQYQAGLRSRSWNATIKEQRKMLGLHLEDNLSLKSALPDTLVDAYEIAVLAAERETGLPPETFPAQCPYTFDQIMNASFLPGERL